MFEVSVADDVLTAQPDVIRELPGVFQGWLGPVLFLVSPNSSNDAENSPGLINSAQAAAHRFRLVTTQGVELPGRWVVSSDSFPDTVIDPRLHEDGVVVGAHMFDGLGPAMATTMLRILLGELHDRKISAHVSCPPEGLDVWSLPNEAVEEGSEPARPAQTDGSPPTRWFITRTLQCWTTTGVPYHETEWLRPDRTWSRVMAGALSFDPTSNAAREVGDFVTSLREEATKDQRGVSVHGVLLSPDSGVPSGSLPPDTIRDHGHVWRSPNPAH